MESPNVSNVSGVKLMFTTDSNKCNCSPTRFSLAESCFSYLKSNLPRRVMLYNCGDWLDFPDPITRTLIDGFKNEKSGIRFLMGREPLLLDFLSMVVINLRTKKQKSVAWIDEAGKCLFPKTFGHDGDDDLSQELDTENLENGSVRTEGRREVAPPPEVIKHVVGGSGVPSAPRPRGALDILQMNLETLERGSEQFSSMQRRFLCGMGPFASSSAIMYIHRYVPKDSTGLKRKGTFETVIKLTEEERGNANVKFAWFGAKKLDSVGVLLHGFGTYGKPADGILGSGLYLTPEARAFASVNLCDIDEKGMQYLIMCRVILGNIEQVHPGTKQFCPSSGSYDSGVDDLSSPKRYVVWSTHTSTYLHPEYFITFKLAPGIQDYLFGLKDIRYHGVMPNIVSGFSNLQPVISEPRKGPNTPWAPFPALLEVIHGQVSPLAMELMLQHYRELKMRLITREELAKKVIAIIGDQMFLSALDQFKHEPSMWYEDPPAKRMKLEGSSSTPQSDPDDNDQENNGNNGSRDPNTGPNTAI